MKYTFYSLRSNSPIDILKIDILRDAGIENILLERGIITEERLDRLLEKIDARRAKEEETSE